MAEHQELVAEMPVLEQMGTQERQKLAKKRRLQQLKKWGQREKEWIAKDRQLNKRLANLLKEDNNGLNLKQYTTFGSAQRPNRTRTQTSATNNNNINNNNDNNTQNNNHCNPKQTFNGNSLVVKKKFTSNGLNTEPSLAPNGRVHFNVGVMLLEAAARNDFDEAKRLMMLGVSPDSVNHDGLTALHQCCIDASEPMMDLLIEFGANVDARDTEQWTPLHAACTCGHLNLVKILVEHGADLLAVNGDGNMPFDICEDEATLDYIESQMVERGITQEMIDITRASTEMQMISDLERLVADKKDLNKPFNDDGVTQLHVAAANNYLSAVKFLLKEGVNVNVCDKDLWSPLHGAACWGSEQHIKVVELLVEAGSQLNAKTINDETVFDLCDNVELLEKLNQLKDELESKQASDADRLKRTQSRTNSRVHSVRRTSVRDKNQISRREAREEALLRVDSSPQVNGKAADEDRSTQQSSSLGSDGDQSDQLSARNSDKSLQSANQVAGDLNSNDSDQVDWSPPSGSQHIHQSAAISRLSPDEADGSKVPRGHELIKTKSSQPVASQKVRLCPRSQSVSNCSIASTSAHVHDLSPPEGTKHDDIKCNEVRKTPLTNCDLVTTSPVTITTDTKQQADLQTNSSQSAQLVPAFYTLSNLKKHRSDLRMRTTCIGGGVITTSSLSAMPTKTNAESDEASEKQNEAPPTSQPATTITPIDSNRSESPTASFRKFHGEPSEVIGNVKRKRRHRSFCVVI